VCASLPTERERAAAPTVDDGPDRHGHGNREHDCNGNRFGDDVLASEAAAEAHRSMRRQDVPAG